MKRIAWFTPLPSSPADAPCHRSALLTRLRERYAVDRFVGTAPGRLQDAPPETFGAYDFVWKQLREPYDLTVYDVADSRRFDFVWPYLVRHPGLVVLHDDRLHHSRRSMLLAQGRKGDYIAEFRYDHPEANPDVPKLGVAQMLGATSDLRPMRRVVIESSRLLVAPNAWIAETLRTEASHTRITVIEPGAPEVVTESTARQRTRADRGIASDAVVFATFGPLTSERRIEQVWSAFALLRDEVPPLHLLICGAPDTVQRDRARQLRLAEHVTWIGGADRAAALSAADVCICLGWPSGRHATISLIECLAAKKPVIVTDLADRVDIPSLDPRDWRPRPLARAPGDPRQLPSEVACVSIDILDEDHSLLLAMSRLARDPVLRERLGRGAHALWSSRFRFDRVVRDFEAVLPRALAIPPAEVRPPLLPAHLRADGTGRVRSLLTPFGVRPQGLPDLAPPTSPEVPSEP